jgi:hypothetical protein
MPSETRHGRCSDRDGSRSNWHGSTNNSKRNVMAGFVMRKNQRLKKLVPVRYLGARLAGEGIISDLSLSGSYITGNVPVQVGMQLSLQIFVPGDQESLMIDRAIVKWVKKGEFGIDFGTPEPKVVEQIARVISALVKKQYGSSGNGPGNPINA